MKSSSNNIFNHSCFRHTTDHWMLQNKAIKTLAHAIGYLLQEEFDRPCNILIATDSRPSGQIIKKALIEGLLDFDHDLFDANIAPTPAVAKAIKDYHPDQDEEASDDEPMPEETFFDLGIVITASHNPADYNGIKILTPYGYLNLETELYISEIFYELYQDSNHLKHIKPEENQATITDFDLQSWYYSEIVETINKVSINQTVLLDCANGATSSFAPAIFKACGYQIISINNDINKPINAHASCMNPTLLIEQIKKYNTTWGCAFDGDGDRVIIGHKNGTIFDGDDIIAIIQQHQRYQLHSTIVGTVMSNQGLEQYCNNNNKKFIRTAVAERNVLDALIKHQAFLGAETCGHIVIIDHALCSDGIFAALLFLETITTQKLNAELLFTKHIQIHKVISISNGYNQEKLKSLIKNYRTSNNTRFIIRASNTEPVIRIMTENIDKQAAEHEINEIIKYIKEGQIIHGF